MNTSGLLQSYVKPEFTYFARDPKYSWFHELPKIHFLNNSYVKFHDKTI